MHILIVEDEKGIVDFLKQGLEEEGFTVSTAFNGKDGLDKAQSLNIDLILLDWMLPNMTGIEICKAIRAQNIVTPIIFLTAKDTVQETIEGLKQVRMITLKSHFHLKNCLNA